MKILYFGSYNEQYTRNLINISGLKLNNAEIIICHVNKPKFHLGSPFSIILCCVLFPISIIHRNIFLLFKGLKLFHSNKYDLIIVGFPGHMEVFCAYVLGKIVKRKVIFDALISLYDTYVIDTPLVKTQVLIQILKKIEEVIYKLPNIILVHTGEDLKYFTTEFNIPSNKLRVLFLGSEKNKILNKLKGSNKKFYNAVYTGLFIPLHGVEYILRAAELSRDNPKIKFILTGKGQTYQKSLDYIKIQKLKNVQMTGWVSKDKLNSILNNSDIMFGIFQNNSTSLRCIPNKIFQAISLSKPVITADTPAIREVFTNKKDILLCKVGNARSLLKAILYLVKNPKSAKKIANGGYKLYQQSFTPLAIGSKLLKICQEIH